MSDFANKLISWQKTHGRRDLPWQNTADPYAIWVSEIMLQQTQVSTVIPYYHRFMTAFSNVASLAAASLDEVLALWSGLGYYARAKNLHRAAMSIMEKHGGLFPQQASTIETLPGIGRSTAAAIAAFAFAEKGAILDGNVKRVLTRVYGIEGFPGRKDVEMLLWQKAASVLPDDEIGVYTQALMDLGASLCARSKPQCESCPLTGICFARETGSVDRYPTARPKKSVPQRQAYFLIVKHQGKILFEKRQNKGVWRELYCFPEFAEEEEARQMLARLGAGNIVKMPSFEQVFTHFRLAIHPLKAEASQAVEGIWLEPSVALNYPIAAPIKKMLTEILLA